VGDSRENVVEIGEVVEGRYKILELDIYGLGVVLYEMLMGKEVRGGIEAFATEARRSGAIAQVAHKPFDDAEHVDALSEQTPSSAPLSIEDIAREVKQLGKRWSLVDGNLQLELYSRSLIRLAEAIQHIAMIADEVNNQPRIALEFPRLTVSIHPTRAPSPCSSSCSPRGSSSGCSPRAGSHYFLSFTRESKPHARALSANVDFAIPR